MMEQQQRRGRRCDMTVEQQRINMLFVNTIRDIVFQGQDHQRIQRKTQAGLLPYSSILAHQLKNHMF
jgi:hypothetical protein